MAFELKEEMMKASVDDVEKMAQSNQVRRPPEPPPPSVNSGSGGSGSIKHQEKLITIRPPVY